MNLSSHAKGDLVYAGLFIIAGFGMLWIILSPSLAWMRDSTMWIWFEFCAFAFFLRAVLAGADDTRHWPRFIRDLSRNLAIFTLSLMPLLALLRWVIPLNGSDFWLGAYLWLVLPAVIGSAAFTMGFLLRIASIKIGY